jgi:hypothetical protein
MKLGALRVSQLVGTIVVRQYRLADGRRSRESKGPAHCRSNHCDWMRHHVNDGDRSSDGDGLTCERRVKVAAVPEEYAWVKEHYPGAKVNMQSLSRCGESPTDELQIRTADGREVTLHFDISSFF